MIYIVFIHAFILVLYCCDVLYESETIKTNKINSACILMYISIAVCGFDFNVLVNVIYNKFMIVLVLANNLSPRGQHRVLHIAHLAARCALFA